jgi:glycosyltransferase involved in cell wall biosynthesis
MKIAFMGMRGIPANYSGFETFVEQLAPRLVEVGHEVTVYNRSHFIDYRESFWKGVRLVRLPTIANKHLETLAHTFLSVFHGLFRGYDIVYICGVGNAPLAWIPRLGGAKVLLNVDGEDWARDKWGGFARRYLLWSEWIATWAANLLVADSRVIEKRYRELYQTDSIFVPYGANVQRNEGTEALQQFGLEKGRYILFVGRIVPENAAHLLIEAFLGVATDYKLVVVGDAPYSEAYKAELRELADDRVVFTGYQFGEAYQQLSCGAFFYVLASGVDGTRPVLLDQMGFGNCVLVRNSSANLEVVGEAGLTFDQERPVESLRDVLTRTLAQPEEVARYRELAVARVQEKYSWDAVTRTYLELFQGLQ